MELGVRLQTAFVFKGDDGNHYTCNLGCLWGDFDYDNSLYHTMRILMIVALIVIFCYNDCLMFMMIDLGWGLGLELDENEVRPGFASSW